jgi:hypothetical protein
MKTLYLDHNIVHYYVKGFPRELDAAREFAALQEIQALHPDVRFAVSDWNVVEAARECARSSAPRAAAGLYASFFEGLRPLFIEGHDTLQRAEIRALAFGHWNMAAAPRSSDWMFTSHFGQVASSRIKEILVGFSLRIYLRHLATTSSHATFDSPVAIAREAIKVGIDAYNAGRFANRELQARITREWLLSLLPERDAHGQWIPIATRKELASIWSPTPKDVFRNCPAVAIEAALADVRAAAGGRIPKSTDALDLMHAVPALAYCDAFVTNDAHLRGHAARACGKAQRSVIVGANLSEALKRL